MRVCVVSGTFHPEPGGPPTFLYHLLPELQARGHTVEVITYGEADAPTNYPYPILRISRCQPIPLRLFHFTRAVLRAGQRADVFFVSDYGLPVVIANLLLQRPIVLRIVADFVWEFCQRHEWIPVSLTVAEFQKAHHPLKVRLLQTLQKTYVRAARQVIVPSKYVTQLVRGWGVKPLIIYNAINPDLFRKTHLPSSEPILITVARLTPVKGVDIVIRAFARLKQRLPEARLVIIGDGPSRHELEKLSVEIGVHDSIKFSGALALEEVAQQLAAAHVFLLGSRTEGLPHVVLEALAAGIPVVATYVGGTPEVIKDGVNGLLVSPEDPLALAEAAERVIRNPILRQKFAQASISTLDRFSWPRLVDEYEAALEQTCADNLQRQ